MRRLVATTVSAASAVPVEQAIELRDHRRLRRAGGERHDELVEGPFHVEGAGDRLFAGPDDGEAAIVGQRIAWRSGDDVIRRLGDANDPECYAPPVHDQRHWISRPYAPRASEGDVENGFVVASRVRPTARLKPQPVQLRTACRRQRQDLPRDRSLRAGPFDARVPHHAPLHRGDARRRCETGQ